MHVEVVWRCFIAMGTFAKLGALQWRHNGRDGVPNHQPHDCLFNRLFKHRSKKTSKLRVTGLCAGNSLVAGEFPAQMASNAENVSIWWRHHGFPNSFYKVTNNTTLRHCVCYCTIADKISEKKVRLWYRIYSLEEYVRRCKSSTSIHGIFVAIKLPK